MKFTFTATTKDGDTYTETLEATDRFEVYRDVRDRGDTIVSLTDESAGTFSLKKFLDGFSTIPLDEKVIFARNLAAMLDAGLPVSRALAVVERETRNARFRNAVSGVATEVKRGGTLASALEKYPRVFPPIMVSMTRAGEESGKLGESFRVVARQLERASNLTKKIRGAMIYPAIVISAMFIIAVLMFIYVVPTLAATFQSLNASLPVTTLVIIAISNFLVEDWYLALGGFIVLVGALIAAARTKQGKRAFDWFFLHVPIINNLVVETNAARTTRTLASLLSAGVEVVLSLSITRDVLENSFYKDVLTEAEAIVTKGGSFSEAFAKHPKLYPPLVPEMLAVGEETGQMATLLTETADFFEESVERQTKDLSTIIEPILMLVIGAGVGFFAVAMIGPIYSLANSIN
ncbi:MAG: type II secretion system F family protein [Patescibacteria group bacterium]|nr:type II secretion system F family protein [Patescibacteria group bacterium]